MASFQKYKTKKGDRWMFKIYTDVNPQTGKRKSTTRRGFKTKFEAEKAARYMENDLEAGLAIKSSSITFQDFSKKWLDIYISENAVKPGTLRKRNYEINRLNKYFANIKMVDINWQQYQNALHEMDKTISKNTLKGTHSTGKMIFKKAEQLELIKKNPTEFSYIPKTSTTVEDLENEVILPKYMEKEELAEFLEVAKEKGLELDFEIFLTLAYTGLRVGELCALKESDIVENDGCFLNITKSYYNPKNNFIKYQLVTPKTKSSKRLIDIDFVVVNALHKLISRNNKLQEEYREEYYDKGFIFVSNNIYPGYPINTETIRQRMKRLLKLAGLNNNLSPHSLRHTHTSLLAESGVDLNRIMERLGHSDDNITKQVYLHTTKATRKKDSEKFGALMRNVMDFDE